MTEVDHGNSPHPEAQRDSEATPDPEAQLRGYADALGAAIVAALAGWVEQAVRSTMDAQALVVTPAIESAIVAAGERATAEIGAAVTELLATDLDEQRTTPLALLRSAVAYPTDVLLAAGALPAERDEFTSRAFPGDLFGLTPASFADVDPGLHELGITWGAAKAFVHRRRRSAS